MNIRKYMPYSLAVCKACFSWICIYTCVIMATSNARFFFINICWNYKWLSRKSSGPIVISVVKLRKQ